MKKLSEIELALKKIATVVQDRLLTKQDALTAGTGINIASDGTISVVGGGGGDLNVIESISVNGTAQTVTNKNVDITVPTTLSSLSDDSTHRLVTDTEKSTWSDKQDSVAAAGSTTKPVYTSAAGTFAECSAYAGGTAVTLNGTSKAASTASFYAPTTAGTSGYYLKSSGSGAPTWESMPTLSKGTTSGSGNAVTDISVSGHTVTLKKGTTFLTSHQNISGKEDKMTISVKTNGTSMTAAVGNYYRFTYKVETLAITLPTLANSNARSVLFFLTTGTSPNVTFTSSSNTIYKSDGFSIDASTTYGINALWNGNAWVINAVKYTT